MITAEWRKDLLDKAKAYCKKRKAKIQLTTLGVLIVNDSDFFGRLKSGGDCRVDTLVKANAWLDEQIALLNKQAVTKIQHNKSGTLSS